VQPGGRRPALASLRSVVLGDAGHKRQERRGCARCRDSGRFPNCRGQLTAPADASGRKPQSIAPS
jgi:hypothetical protein